MRPPSAEQLPNNAPGTPGAQAGARVLTLPQQTPEADELVRGLRARKAASISQLFDQYGPIARCTMIRILGNSVDVDDLVQETFMIVIDKISELRNLAALRSFVVSVAMRVSRNELRKRSVRRFVRWSDVPPPATVEGCDPSQRAILTAVYRVLDALDATSRVLFVMRHIERWELRELADAQGCSLATLKRRLQKAEKRFRAIAARHPDLREFLETAP